MARRRRLEDAELAPEIRQTEQALAAELAVPVRVVVRPTSDDHRAADYLGGALIALFVLLALTLRPDLVPRARVPLLVGLAFVLGASVTARTAGLRRPLIGARRRRERVLTAARAHFMEARLPPDAVLVYLSTLEREAAVVRRAALTRAAEAQLERVREALRVGTPKLVLGAVESMGLYLAGAATEASAPSPGLAVEDPQLAPTTTPPRPRAVDDPDALEPWPARHDDDDDDDDDAPHPHGLVAEPPAAPASRPAAAPPVGRPLTPTDDPS